MDLTAILIIVALSVSRVLTPEQALSGFAGTIVLITHDRHLIRTIATKIVDVRDGEDYSKGHIPGAINLPRELFFAEDGGFLPLDEICFRNLPAPVRNGGGVRPLN